MGMTETNVTAVARRSRNAHLLRFNTRALQVLRKISRGESVVKDFFDYWR
jgi:hypothetical protein